MLGATYEVIHKAEDREEFKKAVERCGLDLPKSVIVRDVAEIYDGSVALEESEDLGGLLVRLRLPAA